jgi:hypothetical protein
MYGLMASCLVYQIISNAVRLYRTRSSADDSLMGHEQILAPQCQKTLLQYYHLNPFKQTEKRTYLPARKKSEERLV